MQGAKQWRFSELSSRAATACVCTTPLHVKQSNRGNMHASSNNIQRQCPHWRTIIVTTKLLLDPTYTLRFHHAIVHPPPSVTPRSIGSIRRVPQTNIHTHYHVGFRSCNRGFGWRPTHVHRRRKQPHSAPRNAASVCSAAVQQQRVCVHPYM